MSSVTLTPISTPHEQRSIAGHVRSDRYVGGQVESKRLHECDKVLVCAGVALIA